MYIFCQDHVFWYTRIVDKSKNKYTTIDAYIALFPNDVQKKLQQMRNVIHEVAPDAVEAISYQIPTFKLHGKNLVHFAAFKDHLSFFPTSSPIEPFKEKLSPYKTSRGTIQFPIDQSIPFDLIREIVQFRVKESTGKV